ncbi:hypothetical protein ACHAWF_010791, partial [Thalassiosira exigua]
CSHKDPKVNTRLAVYCASIYGDTVTVHRGKLHDYLGVNFDYGAQEGKVEILMIEYLQSLIKDFEKIEDLGTPSSTPTVEQLFQVQDKTDQNYAPLPEEKAVAFHRFTAKLLFMSNRARRDAQTPVSFMTSFVKKPNLDYWGKLRRSQVFKRTGQWNDEHGRGGIISGISKIKLNAGRSTVTELYGTHDYLGNYLVLVFHRS